MARLCWQQQLVRTNAIVGTRGNPFLRSYTCAWNEHRRGQVNLGLCACPDGYMKKQQLDKAEHKTHTGTRTSLSRKRNN